MSLGRHELRGRSRAIVAIALGAALIAAPEAVDAAGKRAAAKVQRPPVAETYEVPTDLAATLCEHGDAEVFFDTAYTCALAYELALEQRHFEDAMRYAASGCTRFGHAADCRRAVQLPLVVAGLGIKVPISYAAQIARLARWVCLSGAVMVSGGLANSTGRECASFARHFVLYRDPEYRYALNGKATEYYVAARNDALAAELLEVACKRHRHRESCLNPVIGS